MDYSESFKEIQLTDLERELALYEARKEKFFHLKRKTYLEEMSKDKTYPTLNAEQLRSFVLKKWTENHYNFEVDSENEQIFDALCLYFSNSAMFEALGDNFSLKKGILLFGDIGCGKTEIMRLFMDNSFRSYAVINCSSIADEFQEHGVCIMDKYVNEYQSSRPDLTFGQKMIGICFDDLGTETIKKNYGNISNVMADILFSRHSNSYKLAGQTHITTNLRPDEISQMYGDRIRSRMREMFNVLSFPPNSKDRRK